MGTGVKRCIALLAAFVGGIAITPVDGPDLLLDGCIIRFSSTTPTILETATHHCSERVTSVTIDVNNDLRINHDAIAKVVSVTVAIDETLAARGIIAGASGGLDNTTVTFFNTITHLKVRPDSASVVGSNSNIFVTWLSVP